MMMMMIPALLISYYITSTEVVRPPLSPQLPPFILCCSARKDVALLGCGCFWSAPVFLHLFTIYALHIL